MVPGRGETRWRSPGLDIESRQGSATDPAATGHVPAITAVFPAIGFPAESRTGRGPVPAHPDVPAAHPIPVAAQPHIPGYRGCAIDLHLWRGRLDRHGAGVIAAATVVT